MIVTRKRNDNFAIVPNAVAEDERLSFEARGVLVYLLAKPNDWKVVIGDLQRAGGIGRDKAYRLLNELIEAGYVCRRQAKRPDGTMGQVEYVVYDDPVPDQLPLPVPENQEAVAPLPEKPDAGGPLPEKPRPGGPDTDFQDALPRTHPTKTQSNKNPDSFGALVAAWRRDGVPSDLDAVRRAFDGLPAAIDRDHAVRYAAQWQRMWVLRGKKPRIHDYLRQRAWRDMIDAPPMDAGGLYRITPNREEWRAWLGAIREEYGEVGVSSAIRTGFLLRESRWPPSAPAQTRMALA